MTELPPWILLFLWMMWVLCAYLSVWQVRKFAGYLSRPNRFTGTPYLPLAAVVVPFKGLDQDLPGCLAAHCQQDYPAYRLLLVVESKEDPAYEVLTRELKRYPTCPAEILIAGQAGPDQGQKVNNQLFALDYLDPVAGEKDVWVFADSDAVPDRQWLRAMVGPLQADHLYGATTGYRWLVPDSGQQGKFWSSIAAVINSSVACCLWRRSFATAWGGSMAVRVDVARRGDLRGRLRGAITDDYPLTRMCMDLQRKVYFVPRCLVPTPAAFSFATLWNFAHRQYLITRVYMPNLYWGALAAMALFMAGFVSSWVCLLAACLGFRGPRLGGWMWPLMAIVAVAIAHQWRAMLRRRLIQRQFNEAIVDRLHAAMLLDAYATPLWMALHLLFILRAGIGRTMLWRGIRYRLLGPQKIVRQDD